MASTPEEKRAVIIEYFTTVVIPRHLDIITKFIRDDVKEHSAPIINMGAVEAVQAFLGMMFDAYPWLWYDCNHLLVDGDCLVLVSFIEGEFSGNPLFGTPPTGKKFRIPNLEVICIPENKFAEHWGGIDLPGLAYQTGLPMFGFNAPPKDNKEIVQQLANQYIDSMNKGDIDMTMDVFADSFIDHQTVPGGATLGNTKADVRKAHEMLATSFPDVQFKLEDLLVDGNQVVMRVSGNGTHKGAFFGIPPTNKHIQWTGVRLLRFEDGKFAEGTSELDQVGILQQMGIIPSPPSMIDTEGEKAVIEKLVTALNEGNLDAFDDAMTADVIFHLESNPAPLKGTKWAKMEDGMLHAAFHDFTRIIESMTVTGDRIACQMHYKGTHSGPYMGIPGTGKVLDWSGVTIDRFEDGKIVERWVNIDRFTLLQQVGLIPSFG
ncbi:MAG TPA: ester cyclase family protein [Phototrophicaceae bacterium]|nr:ester cyclase family protein [Phototrophicaceae bacterium]